MVNSFESLKASAFTFSAKDKTVLAWMIATCSSFRKFCPERKKERIHSIICPFLACSFDFCVDYPIVSQDIEQLDEIWDANILKRQKTKTHLGLMHNYNVTFKDTMRNTVIKSIQGMKVKWWQGIWRSLFRILLQSQTKIFIAMLVKKVATIISRMICVLFSVNRETVEVNMILRKT